MKLKKGEIICNLCNGKGSTDYIICKKCLGEGKLDWVENLVGKENEWPTMSTSAISVNSSDNMLSLDMINKVRKEIENSLGVPEHFLWGHENENYLSSYRGKDLVTFKARFNYGFNYTSEGEEIE